MERQLDCRQCRTSFEKGNAATPDGKTIADGIEPEDFMCRDCPLRVSGPLDATSALALKVWNALAGVPEGTASVEFVFSLLQIPYPSALAAEVYHRVCVAGSISHEIQATRAKHAKHQTTGNGQPQDLLAGSGFGDEDDE